MQRSCDVVVVNYNSGSHLAECVASVLAQDGTQLVIVDNASRDDSLEKVHQAFPGDPRLIVLRNGHNLGFAAACNTGYGACRQPLVLFLNPDTVLAPGAIRSMIDVLLQLDEVGMVGGMLCNPDGSEQPGGRRVFPTPRRALVRALRLSRLAARWPRLFSDFLMHKEPLPAEPIIVEAISGACMLVKREAMDDVGHWDEGYFLHCEDLDLCMRFREKNWKVGFVPQARVFHAWGACSRSRPIFVEWHKHLGMMRFYGKFYRCRYPAYMHGVIAAGVWIRFVLVATWHLLRFRRWKVCQQG